MKFSPQPPPRRPQNGTQAHDLSRELWFKDRLMSALPHLGMAQRATLPYH